MIFDQTAEEISYKSLWTEEETEENARRYASHYEVPFPASASLGDWLLEEWDQMVNSEPFWAAEKEDELREQLKDLKVIVRHASLNSARKHPHNN
jgi:hypothetical protein